MKNKYGPNMVAKDKENLNEVINQAIEEFGPDYGTILETIVEVIRDGNYSQALKYNAINKTSWFLKYVKSYVDVYM